jgi:CDGSH-type Zn-finger protein
MKATDRAGASITVYPDGPLIVRGPVSIKDVDGEPMHTGRIIALCRCGRSAIKPFCDGSHKRGPVTAGGQAPSGSGQAPSDRQSGDG